MKLRAQHQAGFTMMEIAIAIGVIAFALIAIMGVLPTGMHIQRDNRQDTIINQDGAYLLEAMRNAAQDIPDLHTFVESYKGQANPFTNTADLIRALMVRDDDDSAHKTNLFLFRSITGPAVMRGAGVPTFRYMVKSQVLQSYVNTNLADSNFTAAYVTALTNNTFDVRLTFLWPVLPNGELADTAQKQVMRTVISGRWDPINIFTPAEFTP